jgi:dTDP-4-amino-4,6-dideoxygalactose transaminase
VTDSTRPAALGGAPAFPDGLPLVRPTVPDRDALVAHLGRILDSGHLTNGPTVRALEEAVAERLGVARAVAVSSCTAGLMLVLRALLDGRSPDDRRVVLPSFTFAASAHAVVWAGGQVDFAEVDRSTLTLDPDDVAGVVAGAAVVSATHVYGTPCDVEGLRRVTEPHGVPLLFDAAHALGSRRSGTPVGGFGSAEVFSLSPTKIVVGGEGGIVSTNDPALAEACALGRDYGNPGDYDCRFAGLNARMSELHAAVALASLAHLDEHVAHRGALVAAFARAIEAVPGLRLATVSPSDVSTYKDLTLVVDPDAFGLDVEALGAALALDGVDTRRYYHPPIHRQQAYDGRWRWPRPLPVTDDLAGRVVSLPLWSHLDTATMERVAALLATLHREADAVGAAIGAQGAGGTMALRTSPVRPGPLGSGRPLRTGA